MKRILLIGGSVILVLLIVLAGVYFLRTTLFKGTGVSTSTDPFGSAQATSTQGSNNGPSLPVRLSDGSTVSVPDFTKTDQPAWASKDAGYQVAGNEDSAYQVLYFEDGSGFLISLLKEPLGQSRLDAESALRAKLGLSNAQLCKLSSQVATSISVNETYAGRELGLSFCPGAIKLP